MAAKPDQSQVAGSGPVQLPFFSFPSSLYHVQFSSLSFIRLYHGAQTIFIKQNETFTIL